MAGLVAYLVVVCFAVTALILFLTGRTWFKEFAHPISAITMFALLGVNALLNGYNLYETRKHQDPAVTQKREVPQFNTYTASGTRHAGRGDRVPDPRPAALASMGVRP